MSEYIHKSHNVTVLMYHLVFPAKYRRVVFDEQVDIILKEVCLEVTRRYQVKFLEIGTDKDHVHFLVQSVPAYSVTKLVTLIKDLISPLTILAIRVNLGPTPAGGCAKELGKPSLRGAL